MTLHQEWLNSLKSSAFNFVYLGDDNTCTITRKGKIEIALDDGGVRTLSEVRCVPKLRKNLISRDTLLANGYSFQSDGDRHITRVRKDAMILMRAKGTSTNIYKLLGSKFMGDITYVETDNDETKLWHMRFNHLNERGMVELHKRNLLKGVRSCTIGLCKYYVLRKQRKVIFKTGQHKTSGS